MQQVQLVGHPAIPAWASVLLGTLSIWLQSAPPQQVVYPEAPPDESAQQTIEDLQQQLTLCRSRTHACATGGATAADEQASTCELQERVLRCPWTRWVRLDIYISGFAGGALAWILRVVHSLCRRCLRSYDAAREAATEVEELPRRRRGSRGVLLRS